MSNVFIAREGILAAGIRFCSGDRLDLGTFVLGVDWVTHKLCRDFWLGKEIAFTVDTSARSVCSV